MRTAFGSGAAERQPEPSARAAPREFFYVNRLRFTQRLPGNSRAAKAVAVLLAIVGAAPASLAQNVNLEPLRSSGYGVVRFERIRPNVLTVNADIDGKAFRLLVDSGWLEDGVGVVDQTVGTAAGPSTGTQISRSRGPRAREVTLGNVRLTGVPIVHGAFPQLRETLIRRTGTACCDWARPNDRRARRNSDAGCAGARAAGRAEVNGVAGKMLVDTGSYLAAIDLRLKQQIGARPVPTKLGHPRPWTMTEFTRLTRIDEHASEAWDLVENAPATKL